MSSYDRGSRDGPRGRRGKAANDRQLGRVQVKVLRWLMAEEVRLELVGTEDQRRSVSRRGVPWVKVAEKVDERRSAVSEALRGEGRRSLVERGLVVLSMSRGGRVTHVKLTTLGRATAEATTPGRSARTIRDSIRRRFVEQHGPRSAWSEDLKLDEQDEVEDALRDVHTESLRLGRPEKNLTPEEFGAIFEDASREWQASSPKQRKSSPHFHSVLVRHVLEFVKRRDGEE